MRILVTAALFIVVFLASPNSAEAEEPIDRCKTFEVTDVIDGNVVEQFGEYLLFCKISSPTLILKNVSEGSVTSVFESVIYLPNIPFGVISQGDLGPAASLLFLAGEKRNQECKTTLTIPATTGSSEMRAWIEDRARGDQKLPLTGKTVGSAEAPKYGLVTMPLCFVL